MKRSCRTLRYALSTLPRYVATDTNNEIVLPIKRPPACPPRVPLPSLFGKKEGNAAFVCLLPVNLCTRPIPQRKESFINQSSKSTSLYLDHIPRCSFSIRKTIYPKEDILITHIPPFHRLSLFPQRNSFLCGGFDYVFICKKKALAGRTVFFAKTLRNNWRGSVHPFIVD